VPSECECVVEETTYKENSKLMPVHLRSIFP
jgi:hypothetical protein